MRVDKFLSEMGKATRTESSKLVRAGKITVNGAVIKRADVHIDPDKDEIRLFGEIGNTRFRSEPKTKTYHKVLTTKRGSIQSIRGNISERYKYRSEKAPP